MNNKFSYIPTVTPKHLPWQILSGTMENMPNGEVDGGFSPVWLCDRMQNKLQ